MSNKTPLIANVVDRYTGRDGSEQSHWTDVGIAFPHKSGEGFNLVIRPGLAVSGTIVLTTKKAREEAEGGAAPEAANFPEEGVVSRNRRNFRHPSRAITRQVA